MKKSDYKVVSQDESKGKTVIERKIYEQFTINDIKDEKKDFKVQAQKIKLVKDRHTKIAESMEIKVKTIPDMYKILEGLSREDAKYVALWAYHTGMADKHQEQIDEYKDLIKEHDEFIAFLDEKVLCQDNEK